MKPEQVKAIIERAGTGNSLTEKIRDIAARTHISVPSLWRYVRDGIPERSKMQATILEQL